MRKVAVLVISLLLVMTIAAPAYAANEKAPKDNDLKNIANQLNSIANELAAAGNQLEAFMSQVVSALDPVGPLNQLISIHGKLERIEARLTETYAEVGSVPSEEIETALASIRTDAEEIANFQLPNLPGSGGDWDAVEEEFRAATEAANGVGGVLNPFKITSASLPDGKENVSYRYYDASPVILAATGGVGTYTWSVVQYSLPSGLTLLSYGEILGYPDCAGTYQFRVRVTDAELHTAEKVLSIFIAGNPYPS